jgi:hypothetical protein
MEAMGIKDYDVWLRQPAFYRDDVLLVAEASADAERSLRAEEKAKTRDKRGR